MNGASKIISDFRIFKLISKNHRYFTMQNCKIRRQLKSDTFRAKSLKYFQQTYVYKEQTDIGKQLDISNGTQNSLSNHLNNNILTLISDLLNQLNSTNVSLSQLEREVSSILDNCNEKEALSITHKLLLTVEDNIKNGVFYKCLLSRASKWISACDGGEELVYWGFIFSLQKYQPLSVDALRLIYQRFKTDTVLFQKLDSIKVSIICNAWFSNNINVSSKNMLRIIEKHLRKKIISSPGIVNQEALSLLKVLRKSGFGTDQLFDALISSLSSPVARDLNLAEAGHALALLADNRCLVNEELGNNILHLVKSNSKKPIQSPDVFLHPSQGTRIKDLTRFLWTASCLVPPDEVLRQNIAIEIIDQVEIGFNNGNFNLEKDSHLLSDFFLSLACWNIYPESLIKKIVNRSFIDTVIKQKQTVRQSRLALFIVAANIEAPSLELDHSFLDQLAANLPPYKVEKEFLKRPSLMSLAGIADRYREKLEWTNIHCHSTIPHLNLAGITFNWKGTKVAVEVLDPYVCMRHSNLPERLLAFKIRLSKQLGYRVIMLDAEQDNRKQQEVDEEQKDYNRDQRLTRIRQCLESDYVNDPS